MVVVVVEEEEEEEEVKTRQQQQALEARDHQPNHQDQRQHHHQLQTQQTQQEQKQQPLPPSPPLEPKCDESKSAHPQSRESGEAQLQEYAEPTLATDQPTAAAGHAAADFAQLAPEAVSPQALAGLLVGLLPFAHSAPCEAA